MSKVDYREILRLDSLHYAGTLCDRAKRTGTDAKNMGVEETNPRRPHFVVTGENTGTGAGDR